MILKQGDQGDHVKLLQEHLIAFGFFSLQADGLFDMNTHNVVALFQRNKKLKPDGIVGPQTWARLKPQNDFLKNITSLKKTPTNIPIPITDKPSKAVDIINRWGQLVKAIANRIEISPAAAIAIMQIESGGNAFTKHGCIIRFENHVFSRQKGVDPKFFKKHFSYHATYPWLEQNFSPDGKVWKLSHIWPSKNSLEANQAREWEAFTLAQSHNREAAIASISMGLPQMMGFNYHLLGYSNMLEMFEAFSDNAHAQILGMFDFIIGVSPDEPMLKALQNKDFVAFAQSYNGPGKAEEYGEKIADAYKDIISLEIDGFAK